MIVTSAKLTEDLFDFRSSMAGSRRRSSVQLSEPDIQIYTSGGLNIPAHSSVLSSASRVLEKLFDRPQKRRSSEKIIPILGVPCDAVVAFVRFHYSLRCTEEEMEKYGIHLLVLSHVFSAPQLKHKCIKGLPTHLTVEKVVDVLKIARLCDAPELYLNCMKFLSTHFKAIEETEAWKFLQNYDPWLELEILQFLNEAESRKKRREKIREEQNLYMQLSEAMECLEHICTEGCTSVGPYDKNPNLNKGPCNKFSTCQGLQLMIRHFATCNKRLNGGCCRCKRMWQLFRLHSSICDQSHHCKVPLCRQFKLRTQIDRKGKGKGEDGRWRLLGRKVISAKAISTLSLLKKEKRFGTMRITLSINDDDNMKMKRSLLYV